MFISEQSSKSTIAITRLMHYIPQRKGHGKYLCITVKGVMYLSTDTVPKVEH